MGAPFSCSADTGKPRKRHPGFCNGGGVPVTINNTGMRSALGPMPSWCYRWWCLRRVVAHQKRKYRICFVLRCCRSDVDPSASEPSASLCCAWLLGATMPLGLKPCCAVCKTNSSSMWKKGSQGEILCNSCTGKSSSGGPAGPSIISSIQPSNGGGKQVSHLHCGR